MDDYLDDVQQSDGAEGDSIFSRGIPLDRALEKLRLRLLDLTGNNRLINFKHVPSRSLRFIHSTIDGSISRLLEPNARVRIAAVPEPPENQWVEKDGRMSRPPIETYAPQVGINPSFVLDGAGAVLAGRNPIPVTANDVFALHYVEDLGKYCRKVDRESKLAIEETGANQLYLVAGFLQFSDVPNSDKIYHAPLLCVPVEMVRVDSSEYSTFYIRHTGEEITDNLSLREKLKRDFNFNLPDYDEESDMSPEEYLQAVAQAIDKKPNWRVRPMLTLALLKFANLLLFRDLQPERWGIGKNENALLDHPIVKQVFEGSGGSEEAEYAEEYRIDDHPRGDLPLIYDADSSQHSALIDVAEGKNRVVEGPPGTGKSQTITNLIAVAMHEGKKVLFMAEKLTALAIVKARLARAGLDPFILELHSNKTNKKRVLEDLAARIEFRPAASSELPAMIESFEEKRAELKVYAALLNSHVGNLLDLTIHQVIWRAERHRLQAGESAYAVQSIDYFSPQNVTKEQFTRKTEALRYLVKQHEQIGGYNSKHPMWGLFIEELSPEDDVALRTNLREFEGRFSKFETAAAQTLSLLQDRTVSLDGNGALTLLNLLANVAPSDAGDMDYEMLPTLFSRFGSDGAKSLAVLTTVRLRIQRVSQLESSIGKSLVSPTVASQSMLDEANVLDEALQGLGRSKTARSDLEACHSALGQSIAHAEESLRRLKDVADTTGLRFEAKLSDTKRLRAFAFMADGAPVELLRYRHDGLAVPGAASKLDDAMGQVAHIGRLHATAERDIYVDQAPSDRDLFAAIQKLREGGRWYRIFQGNWRAAIKLHRTISKSSTKMTWQERLSELEQLQTLLAARNKLANDAKLKSICGAHFDAERSPFQELHKLASWIENSDTALESAGVDTSVQGAVSVRRDVIEELRSRAEVISDSLERLKAFDDIARNRFSDAAPKLQTELGSLLWTDRLATAKFLLQSLDAAILFQKPIGLREASISAVRDALGATVELSETLKLLDDDTEARALLGTKYLGRDTELDAVFAAHTYGSLVKKAKPPTAVERLLIAGNAVENHARLAKLMEDIELGWTHVAEFSREMCKLGRFELGLWVNSDPADVAAFSSAIAAKGRQAVENLVTLLPWAQYGRARSEAKNQGLGDFIRAFEEDYIAGSKLEHAFAYRFYAAITKNIFEQHPPLRQFSGVRHSTVRAEFGALDKEIIQLRGSQIASNCDSMSSPPRGHHGARVDDKTEMTLLEHLIPQQRPRLSVRKIMQRAGRAIQELKPVFMMGPQAVAQFLEPGRMHFDIIVMDEASQLRPEQAIGAIARGTQLVIVGDPKQLPPTNFFGASMNDDDEDGSGQHATDSESILDTCISHFQPVRSLRWHYRSQHESLIAFSNHHFYRGNLVVFPSPYAKSKKLGVTYVYVQDGEYESQMNPIEARRVVDAIVEHILKRPNDSLGIVAPNVKQRDLISEMLEDRLRDLPQAAEFQEYWKEAGMDLFVKNLENVQGDERDSIIISTTYGRAKGATVVRQNFGPINKDGGWRRLNVLFTRAKKSVLVISSMRPEDIVYDNKTPRGTRAFRDYLQFAKTGIVPTETETNLPPDSDFEVAIIDVLQRRGYEVTPQLGVAGFRIDIAVRNPNNLSGYLAAIECDGAAYHSGITVRDRDRIRQEVLENLGWKGRIWRIWSTDWFRNPLTETEKLLSFLDRLRSEAPSEEPAPLEEIAIPLAQLDARTAARELDIADTLLVDEEEDIEVEVGDLVTYFDLNAPDIELKARISHSQNILEEGIVSQTTPLGSTLLGATVGDRVVLRVPGKEPTTFLVKAIKRPQE